MSEDVIAEALESGAIDEREARFLRVVTEEAGFDVQKHRRRVRHLMEACELARLRFIQHWALQDTSDPFAQLHLGSTDADTRQKMQYLPQKLSRNPTLVRSLWRNRHMLTDPEPGTDMALPMASACEAAAEVGGFTLE